MGSALKYPPGPWSVIPGGDVPALRRDTLGFMWGVSRRYGDIASFRVLGRRFYLLSHPEQIREVLVTRAENFTKAPALRAAKATLGEGLLTSEGDFHRRQRRIIQPAFHSQRVSGYANTMVFYAKTQRDAWRAGEVIDVREAMTGLTLRVIAKILFDAEIDAEVDELGKAMDVSVKMFDRARSPFAGILNRLPLKSNRTFLAAQGRLYSTIDGMIAKRRERNRGQSDLLSILLAARDETGDGEGMDHLQLRWEMMTLFSAGHETTANALVWTWLLLAENPAARERLDEELRRELGGRLATAGDVSRLVYTRAVVAESMRLYPPAWIVARQAKEAFELGKWKAPSGAVVFMPQWIVHRDPRWWAEAERFKPERWMDGPEEAAGRPKYAYFPFGGGPRNCVGESLAWMEAVLLLATVAQKWKLERADDSVVRLHPTITLRPRDPLMMRLVKVGD